MFKHYWSFKKTAAFYCSLPCQMASQSRQWIVLTDRVMLAFTKLFPIMQNKLFLLHWMVQQNKTKQNHLSPDIFPVTSWQFGIWIAHMDATPYLKYLPKVLSVLLYTSIHSSECWGLAQSNLTHSQRLCIRVRKSFFIFKTTVHDGPYSWQTTLSIINRKETMHKHMFANL